MAEERKHGGIGWGYGLVAALMLYVLSIGPAERWGRKIVPVETLGYCYLPVILLVAYTPLDEPLCRYIDLWKES